MHISLKFYLLLGFDLFLFLLLLCFLPTSGIKYKVVNMTTEDTISSHLALYMCQAIKRARNSKCLWWLCDFWMTAPLGLSSLEPSYRQV